MPGTSDRKLEGTVLILVIFEADDDNVSYEIRK
jgi:hypothetical protein